MPNESLLTVSQETTESVTINDRTNPQTFTVTFSSAINTAALTTAQGEVKQKINTKNNILMGLYLNPQGDQPREVTLRKYKKYLKPEVLCVRRGKEGGG